MRKDFKIDRNVFLSISVSWLIVAFLFIGALLLADNQVSEIKAPIIGIISVAFLFIAWAKFSKISIDDRYISQTFIPPLKKIVNISDVDNVVLRKRFIGSIPTFVIVYQKPSGSLGELLLSEKTYGSENVGQILQTLKKENPGIRMDQASAQFMESL